MTLTFDQLEKAAYVREIAENSKDFHKWAKENKRSPENFCDWGEIISEFYEEQTSFLQFLQKKLPKKVI